MGLGRTNKGLSQYTSAAMSKGPSQVCLQNDLRRSMYLVDCGKHTIQLRDIYHLPHNTTHLRSYRSGLKTLPNGSFDNVTNLLCLDLSRNQLETIASDAFAGLTNLVTLDLSGNIPLNLGEFLWPLSSLRALNIRQINDVVASDLSGCLSGNAVKYIINGNSWLRQLERIQISCISITKDDVLLLQNTSVKYLSITEVLGIDSGAFSSWTTLKSLQLNMLHVSASFLPNIACLGGLLMSETVFKNLSSLHVEHLYIQGGLNGKPSFEDFNAPNLKALTIQNTDVEFIDFGPINAPKLQWLNIAQNRISSLDIPQTQQLHYLDISHQKSKDCLSSYITLPDSLTSVDFSGTRLCSQLSICLFHVEFVNLRNTWLTEFFNAVNLCYWKDAAAVVAVKPHRMTAIKDFFRLFQFINEINSIPGDQLNNSFHDDILSKTKDYYVDISCANTTEKVAIRHLNLQDNNIECINSSVFNQYDWSALNVLDLSNNKLGFSACPDTNPSHFMDFLMPLWNLTDLYIDGNPIIYDLIPTMLLNQTNLQTLHLSQTTLTNLTIKMGHLMDLNLLDISHNKIQCLYASEMRDISAIIHHTPGRRNVSKVFELNLSHNPLRYSCSCLEFYLWIRNVRPYITFTHFNSYQCTFDNGNTTNLSDLNSIVNILHSQCVSTDWYPAVTMTTAILILYSIILATTTSFRFRHSLRYIWLKHKMHREYLERHILDPKCRFDAFVSCDRTDAIWVKRNFLPKLENQETGLKFCVAQRDFLVGATIIDNIVRSINQSRKVVFVISQNFLRSGWCKEELLIGHQESLSRGKNILICIFMPDIIHNQLPNRFRFILNHMTCIKWPRIPAAQQVFWIKLQRALQDHKEPDAMNKFAVVI